MPAYYNPYAIFPATYGYGTNYAPVMQNQNMVDIDLTMKWVEGEVGAKAFQMPQGWPANKPIALWDSTDTVVWLKSWNQMGMPNPMQRLKYEMPDQNVPSLPTKHEETASFDMSRYVTKDDLADLKNELRNMLKMNQNGSNLPQNPNRGGSK